MERLKKVIERYGRWSELTTYTDRIEAHASTDFSHAIENAKALLETIGKEICNSKGVELGETASINAVMKKAFTAIGYSSDNMVTQISSALANIGQQMGNLRNEIGTTSHGKSLEELKERNNKVDELTKEFLIDTTVIVASFLIRTFENKNPRAKTEPVEAQLPYTDNEPFNDFWDDLYGEFPMGDYSFPAKQPDFLLYTGNHGKVNVEVFLKDETVWLTQKAIGELFGKERSVITKHLKNIFASGELEKKAMCKKCTLVIRINPSNFTTSMLSSQSVTASITIKPRSFASGLPEHRENISSKGFVLDDERLKQGNQVYRVQQDKDYLSDFDREIRRISGKKDGKQNN